MKISDVFNIYSEDHRFTEEFLYKNKGKYPVYSATQNNIYGYTNEYAYDKQMILVVNYGDAGKTRTVSGKFNIGRNICGLTLKKEYEKKYNLEYMSIVLEKAFTEEIIQGNMGCISINTIKNIELKLPEISINEQINIIKKIDKLKDLYIKLNMEISKIKEILEYELKIDNFIELKMSEIALLNKGSNKISEEKIYKCYEETGIPIYSSATQNDGLMGRINKDFYNSIDKKGNAGELTWTTNGYAGKVFYRDTKYLYTEKCGRIVLKDKYKKLICNKYLMYYLNQITYKYKTSESNNGKLDIIHMSNIPVKIPINKNNEIDIKEQEKIANMYEHLYMLQKKLELINEKI